jgi:hypothetical protein
MEVSKTENDFAQRKIPCTDGIAVAEAEMLVR